MKKTYSEIVNNTVTDEGELFSNVLPLSIRSKLILALSSNKLPTHQDVHKELKFTIFERLPNFNYISYLKNLVFALKSKIVLGREETKEKDLLEIFTLMSLYEERYRENPSESFKLIEDYYMSYLFPSKTLFDEIEKSGEKGIPVYSDDNLIRLKTDASTRLGEAFVPTQKTKENFINFIK